MLFRFTFSKMLRLLLVIICLHQTVIAVKLTCRNETGAPVDWYINYKIPKLEKESGLVGEGFAYAYLVSNRRTQKWTLSKNNISSPTSMLGYTLEGFYENPEDFTYLLYNDDNPDSEATAVGHTKGIVVFNDISGFWIIHSIPKFPSPSSYSYPSNAVENGQSILCISFDTSTLNEIGKQLLFNHPSIYAKHLTLENLDDDVNSLFSEKPKFIRKEPFQRVTTIKSRQGRSFTIFAKDNQFKEDLYSELIAPELRSSLVVETWRRGSGNPLDPSCNARQTVLNVQSINLSLSGRGNANIAFSSMEDHSKWAVSTDVNTKWVCIGDINRMESQKRRGGGAACFEYSIAWKAFTSSINSTDHCNITI